MSFYERIYLYQAYCWYYYILQDFVMYYRYTQKWVDLFTEYPGLARHRCGPVHQSDAQPAHGAFPHDEPR